MGLSLWGLSSSTHTHFCVAFFQTPRLLSHPQRRLQHQLKSDTSLMAASLLASSSSSSRTPSSGPATVRTLLKTAKQQRACPGHQAPPQPPLRGSVGHWISRLSVFGWRNHQPSASYRTGPSTPRAPRGWEQVTSQNGPQFCQNPVPLLRDNQRQGVEYRFSVI